MRVLVTWSSKRGGTEGIGHTVGEELQTHGFEIVESSIDKVDRLESFDAIIVGGALYAGRWPRAARSFVNHHLKQLRKVPVWFFSSGPLDDSADRELIPATAQVADLAERIGAKSHVTFGGRLTPDAKGFPASAMAKKTSGDWRNQEKIRAWADEVAAAIPTAKPGAPVERPAHSIPRLLTHGVVGWALCAVTMFALMKLASLTPALVVHAIAAPLFFALIARNYFGARGARESLPTAIVWTCTVALLDLVIVAGAVQRSLEMFQSFAGTWLPLGLIFLATWATGEIMLMVPPPKKKNA